MLLREDGKVRDTTASDPRVERVEAAYGLKTRMSRAFQPMAMSAACCRTPRPMAMAATVSKEQAGQSRAQARVFVHRGGRRRALPKSSTRETIGPQSGKEYKLSIQCPKCTLKSELVWAGMHGYIPNSEIRARLP